MSTTFYIRYGICECCNRYERMSISHRTSNSMLIYQQKTYVKMHFLDPKYIIMDNEDDEEFLEINSFKDWREFIDKYGEKGFNTIKIYDEYSTPYTEKAFYQEIQDYYNVPEFKKISQSYAEKYKDHFWLDPEGYCIGESND